VRPDARFVFVGSAEAYGREFKGGALKEDSGFSPMNPYAASKAAGDILVRQQAVDGLRTIVLRPFNHVGPGQRQDFVVSAFCSQIARIERGLQEPIIQVGNLEARRDFLDVRDVLDAYVAVVGEGRDIPAGSVFNLASGRTVTIREVLDDLLSLSDIAIDVRVDPARLRPRTSRSPWRGRPAPPSDGSRGSWRRTLSDTLTTGAARSAERCGRVQTFRANSSLV
jgi:GDP-4-dehydro-6-deoxy-D-mannose reductase